MHNSVRGLVAVLGVAAVLALTSCSVALDTAAPDGPNSSATRVTASPATGDPRAIPFAEPGPPDVQELTAQYAAVRSGSMSVREKVASLFIVGAPGLDGAAWQATVASRGLGGLILMGGNIPPTTAELAALTAGVTTGTGLSPLIAIDEEGGDVVRLPQDAFAGADVLAGQPEQATRDAFTARSDLLVAAGVSVNFGVIADVTADPSSFIFSRAFGGDASSASPRVAAAVAGEHGKVFSTLKHFPGHGETDADSHTSIPSTALDIASWRVRDAPSFEAGIDAGAELVMFGHLVYSVVDEQPASLSPAWHALLRDELGFDGVTVTDDLGMLQDSGLAEYQDANENAIRAVAAGNDLLLYVSPTDIDGLISAVTAAVESGRIDPATLDDAVTRDLELRRSLWLRQNPGQEF